MKLEYRSVGSDELLDTITVNGTRLRYDTGAARDLFEGRIELLGRKPAIQALKNWSNGYVLVREVPATGR